MRIGIPREIKSNEGRVGLVPAACSDLLGRGHALAIERGAGALSGYSDDDYRAVGVEIAADAVALYGESELIVKVKEPLDGDLPHLRADHRLFCYLHLAAAPELTKQLQTIGLTAVAFETVEEQGGYLPLLAPMSDIAGKLSIQIGTHLLHQPQGGKGLLLGGLPAAERGRVVIIGAGVAGGNAAALAAVIGAEVTIFDRKRTKLERMRALGNNVTALYPYADAVHEAVVGADLLVGAALVTGAKAPHVVSAEMVREMGAGGVIIDISVDQGGCIETTKPTSYEAPTFVWEGVTHFGVTNMPGAVPRSASQALSAALIPYVQSIATPEWEANEALKRGINVRAGEIVHPALLD